MEIEHAYNLIIGGVHKSGTTSFFTYLMHHPEICGSSKKEIHFFTPLRYGKNIDTVSTYYDNFKHYNGEKYILEASPSYLYGKELISNRIFSEFKHPKIIFVLRNPVQRFISYFKNCQGKFIIPADMTFDNFFELSLKFHSEPDTDLPHYRALREGLYSEYLQHWLEQFGSEVQVIFFEDLIKEPKEILKELCLFLNIDSSFYDNYTFNVENKSLASKNKILYKFSSFVNKQFEFFFRKNPALKNILKKIYFRVNTKKKTEELSTETLKKLERFYADEINRLNNLMQKYRTSHKQKWK